MDADKRELLMSFEEFYETFYQKIYVFFYRKCSHKEHAEDLTSQVFEYCLSNYEKYDPNKASMASWVYLIASSRFKNYCRDRRNNVDIEPFAEVLQDDSDPVDTGLMMDELRRAMAHAISMLPETQRMIVVMSYFKKMSSAEIGEKLGMSPINVRVNLSRALPKLRPYLQDFL